MIKGRYSLARFFSIPLIILMGAVGLEAQSSLPQAADLLETVLSGPKTAYEGRVMLTQWFGKQTRAEEARVYFSPPNRYRWEYLSPGGALSRVVVSDGALEQLWLPNERKILVGNAVHSGTKLIVPDQEKDILLKNYRVSVSGTEEVVGRPTWVLEFTPLIKGKPRQTLWVDRQTGVVLETKRIGSSGARAGLSRFSQFKPGDVSQDRFELLAGPENQIDKHGLNQEFLTLKELNDKAGKSFTFPDSLKGGFVFESGNIYKVKGTSVCHLRYTDGLALLSLFETNHSVRKPAENAPEFYSSKKTHSGAVGEFSSGKVLQWTQGRQHFTLIGDASDELLEEIASQMKSYHSLISASSPHHR